MTPTPEQLAEWTNAAQKVWDSQGRTHWVNMDGYDNYIAGYLRARTELLDQPEQNLTEGKWYSGEDIDRMVRQLDVALYGENAAQQAMLCDIVQPIIKRLAAQSEGEPVAWILQFSHDSHKTLRWRAGNSTVQSIPLYTHPPAPRKPITADDVTGEMLQTLDGYDFINYAEPKALVAAKINAFIKHRSEA